MKTTFTIMCLLLWGCISLAQNIEYGYDAAGNRISKKSSGALPVTLVSFTAEKYGKSGIDGDETVMALLNWQTSAEVNSDRFSIQRSQDGQNWLEIGSVQALSNTKSEDYDNLNAYTFIDKEPREGENLYRLQMIDKDGSSAFSKVRSVYFELNILAFPNPVKSLLTLKWSGLETVQIFDNSGKLIQETSKNASTINVSLLSVGVYIFKLTNNDGTSVIRKIVKE